MSTETNLATIAAGLFIPCCLIQFILIFVISLTMLTYYGKVENPVVIAGTDSNYYS